MRIHLALALSGVGLTGLASAQVTQYAGPSANLTTALDFDTPFVATGPIASNDPVFTAAGITAVNIIGTPTASGDTLTAASNVMGQGLITQGGVLTVAGAPDPLDNVSAGGGWEVVLAAPVDEFQVLFIDQVNMNYDIELLNGATSLGIGSFNYAGGFPNPPHFWRGPSPFDTVRITFPTPVGVGIDEFAFGNGPPPMPPANNDCASAAPAVLGVTALSNLNATASGVAPSCAGTGDADVWYSFTASSSMDLQFETCGSNFDSVLEVYSGTCGALASVACNDDSCGLQSAVSVSGANAGDMFLVQVSGFNGAQGTGNLTIREVTPPPPPPIIGNNCVTTLFATNNGGSVGGAVYFDLTGTAPITVGGVFVNTSSTATGIGVDLYTTPGTYVGNEALPGAWTQVATGALNGVGQGTDNMTYLEFLAPAALPAGTMGIALVAQGFNHRYTNGSGANQNYVSPDGIITLDLGSATNVPFTGTPFMPRVWNGVICNGTAAPGNNYCMANANSTGVPTVMSASGSASVMANDLVLEASDMPNNSFAFFITSQTQGFVANPNGSEGNLCLGGAIGRYVGMGQIQSSGATGAVSLAIDNSMHPTPTGLVQVVAGETWNFQLWHRDFVGGPTSNFSDGLEILFY